MKIRILEPCAVSGKHCAQNEELVTPDDISEDNAKKLVTFGRAVLVDVDSDEAAPASGFEMP